MAQSINKHNITHIMYIEMENVISNKTLTHNVDFNIGSSITMFSSILLKKHMILKFEVNCMLTV